MQKNGKPSVVEYTEITDEMAEQQDENGELVYGESHILCNLFNIDCLEEIGKINYHIIQHLRKQLIEKKMVR